MTLVYILLCLIPLAIIDKRIVISLILLFLGLCVAAIAVFAVVYAFEQISAHPFSFLKFITGLAICIFTLVAYSMIAKEAAKEKDKVDKMSREELAKLLYIDLSPCETKQHINGTSETNI